jgi:hypothetical protein
MAMSKRTTVAAPTLLRRTTWPMKRKERGMEMAAGGTRSQSR